MKYILIFSAVLGALLLVNLAFSHFNGYSGFGPLSHRGIAGYHMMDDHWQNENSRHMLGNTGSDLILSYTEELELSKTQVSKLMKIRDNYENRVAALEIDLNRETAVLSDLLGAKELNTTKIREVNGNISKINAKIRSLNIETFTSAKMLLTREQLVKVNALDIIDVDQIYGHYGMAGCW